MGLHKAFVGIVAASVFATSASSFAQNVQRIDEQPTFRGACDGTAGEGCFGRVVGQLITGGLDIAAVFTINNLALPKINQAMSQTKPLIEELAELEAAVTRAKGLLTREQREIMLREMRETAIALRAAAADGTEVRFVNKLDESGRVMYQPAIQSQIVELERQREVLSTAQGTAGKKGASYSSRLSEIDTELTRIRQVNTPMQLVVNSSSTASQTQTIRIIRDKELGAVADAYENEISQFLKIQEVSEAEKAAKIVEARYRLNHRFLTLAPSLIKRGLIRLTKVVAVAGIVYFVVDVSSRGLLLLTNRDPSVLPLVKAVAPDVYSRLFGTK